ncbi:MAG TPA: LD-carboxypeptidase [Bacteroidia bacterium]|nr:LD-carboxypeptidase [Bacteroidia bacterium]
MIFPPPLVAGDTVAIVATARKVSRDEMAPAIGILQQWGLQVVEGENLYADKNQFAGDDSLRAEDFQWALDNPKIKAVLFARGGYGSVRIIDRINFSEFKINPKWLIGFSDITTIHSHVHNQLNVATLHAPMAINFPKTPDAVLKQIKDFLFGNSIVLNAQAHLLNRMGNAKGQLVGGNLSILYSLTASASDIDTKGKILFLEDLDEYLYHIDRMMMQLKRCGKLHSLAGLVVGAMSDMKDNTIPFGKTAEEIIAEHVSEYDFPVCFNFPAGHITENNPLALGGYAKLIVANKVSLKVNNKALS